MCTLAMQLLHDIRQAYNYTCLSSFHCQTISLQSSLDLFNATSEDMSAPQLIHQMNVHWLKPARGQHKSELL